MNPVNSAFYFNKQPLVGTELYDDRLVLSLIGVSRGEALLTVLEDFLQR